MSDTPRTDAQCLEPEIDGDSEGVSLGWIQYPGVGVYVRADFARTLERELSALRALLADALDALTDGGVICDGVEPLKVDSPCKVCRTVARIRVELGDGDG